ncbi:TonB-dependent siderophore receptor [uncultured Parasphingopyxis sp.]|uniref:TonB-dependent receptor plug domain-containing protein n=1 Tax=uncultured Parasphingopyxis sp. TaxID=1547918 RepID=UPI00260FB6D3|nr:TonB-dependent receptor [uncultured Parasphingopyxis sp.]
MRLRYFLLSGSMIAASAQGQAVETPPAETGDAPPPVATPVPGGGRDFTPADFARFSPTTALDMVQQVPGFQIQEAEDRRGLGQGGANVLINGERVSGKSNDAVTALRRISASNVTRIELRDAATLDIPGLSGQVVNIVAETGAVSGNFSWRPQFRAHNTSPRLYSGEISVTGGVGPVDYTLSLSNTNDSFRSGNDGIERVFDGFGNQIDERYEVLTVSGDRPRLAGSFRIDGPGSSVGNLNLSYERYYFGAREESERSFPGTVDRFRLFREGEDEWNYEIGGDFEFALGPGRLKLIGLRSFEHSPYFQSVVTDFADGTPSVGSRFEQVGDEAETILRSEYSWSMGGDWQISLEGARNTLDVESRLFNLDMNGDFIEVPLPGGSARVNEDRAEANITYGRPLSEDLTLQVSLGGEYSEISQTGAGGLTRSFYRPKGFASLAWSVSDTLDLRARVEREVGQLNFFDFVASVNVGSDSEDASNPNLVPPQSWNFEVEGTQQLGPWGSVTARIFYESITDIVDQIPLSPTAQAPGNIDSARRMGFEWNSTFNFDPIGLRGAKLDIEAIVQRTRLDDPLTGLSRPDSSEREHYIEAEFRHDIPDTDIAYGFEFESYNEALDFRLDQLGQYRQSSAFVGAYVEHKDVFGLRVRGSVFNLIGNRDDYRRITYVDRRDGPVDFIEDRSRRIGPIFTFTISGSF